MIILTVRGRNNKRGMKYLAPKSILELKFQNPKEALQQDDRVYIFGIQILIFKLKQHQTVFNGNYKIT